MKYINFFVLTLIFGMLTACGGGDDGFGGDTGTQGDGPGGSSGTNPSATDIGSIVITSPRSNAIVDNENGTYRKKFSVSVADQDGTPLDNSTEITLQVVDTILVTGTISGTNPDNASGTTALIPSVTDAAGTAVPDLTTTYVVRPGVIAGTHRNILANDLFILTGNVDSRDVVRSIAANPTVADSLTVSSIFNSSYPAYDNTGYMVTASMLSASVAGEDADGNLVPGAVANPLNNEGVATVWVTYPADVAHIHSGCTPDEFDDRVSPAGSSQPMLVATAGGITTVYPFCFSSIAGYSLTAVPKSIVLAQGDDQDVTVCVVDGGDGVSIPHLPVSAFQTDGDATVAITYGSTDYLPLDPPSGPPTPLANRTHYTNGAGCFTINIDVTTGASGNTSIVTAYAADGEVSISVSVP